MTEKQPMQADGWCTRKTCPTTQSSRPATAYKGYSPEARCSLSRSSFRLASASGLLMITNCCASTTAAPAGLFTMQIVFIVILSIIGA